MIVPVADVEHGSRPGHGGDDPVLLFPQRLYLPLEFLDSTLGFLIHRHCFVSPTARSVLFSSTCRTLVRPCDKFRRCNSAVAPPADVKSPPLAEGLYPPSPAWRSADSEGTHAGWSFHHAVSVRRRPPSQRHATCFAHQCRRTKRLHRPPMAAYQDKHVGGNLTDQAHQGWHTFARDQGVNVVALLEAMGQKFSTLDPDTRLPDWLRAVVRDARTIGYERARRSKKPEENQ